ncbi:hypothetical protein [Nocardia wallacei]|uniref:hypothetical protein n=1 Tax=Nocardia wallacei TaxID=480035 RepID=UPI0024590615|nr:hypothetical protein [Nocardia wallacei]
MSGTDEPDGVWMCAHSYPVEGITVAIPYASELDALRHANSGDVGRAVFVPYGKDLREVLNA